MIRKRKILDNRPDHAHDTREVGFRNVLAIHLDALAKIVNVGREIRPHSISRGAEDRGREHRGGTLTLGSTDMYHSQPALRVADPVEESLKTLVSELDSQPYKAPNVGGCFIVIHERVQYTRRVNANETRIRRE